MMRVLCFTFLFVFAIVLPCFSAVNTNSESMRTPEMAFNSWRIGRSPIGTDTMDSVHLSFITSTETTCWVKVSVGYRGGNQPKNIVPINPDTVEWAFVDLSHGMTLAEPPGKTWSGKHPSKLSGSTSFNMVAKLNVPKHKGTSQSHCPNYKGTKTPLNGRNDEPMTFKIKFTASTIRGQSVSAVLPLVQDEIDQMRQEYLDMARLTTKTTIDGKLVVDGNVLRVPDRDEFSDENSYDDGHYAKMLDKDLAGKHDAWTQACKDYAKAKFNNAAMPDLEETGGYRNPHHHYYHVGGPRRTLKLSKHLWLGPR